MAGISIALATCNGESFLAEQLESLAGQTSRPAELIVTDDASSDGTCSIIEHFAKTAPFPVKLHRNESRLGYRANFMHAVALCSGELIGFCDQDDIWDARKLETVAAHFRDRDVLLVYHNATIADSQGQPLGPLFDNVPDELRFGPLATDPWRLVPGFTQVFRRSLTEFAYLHALSVDAYWPNECLAHDQWYLFLASVLGTTVQISQPLVKYRQHGANAFGWSSEKHLSPQPGYVLRNEGFITAARNRSELLRRLRDRPPAQVQGRVRAGIAYYDALHGQLVGRKSVYDSPSFGARARAVHALLKHGAYASGQGATSYGWRGLLLDVCAGVPLGAKSKRLFS